MKEKFEINCKIEWSQNQLPLSVYNVHEFYILVEIWSYDQRFFFFFI